KGKLDGDLSEPVCTSYERHRPAWADRRICRRVAAASRVHPLSTLDGRHLLLPGAAVGLRNLPALDLPLLHAAVRRRCDDAPAASLVRLGLRLLLCAAGDQLA